MAKLFFNSAIVSEGEIDSPQERGFHKVNVDRFPDPEYSNLYFETIPSVWANAYAFKQSLEIREASAIEEWASLMLLFYFNHIHIETIGEQQFKYNYNESLWQILEGTYPTLNNSNAENRNNELKNIYLLRNSRNVTLGAYYKPTIFFPARGRKNWHNEDSGVSQFLNDKGLLSWEKCFQIIKTDGQAQNALQTYLRQNALNLKSPLKELLERFCNENFNRPVEFSESIPVHPVEHTTYNSGISVETLIDAYPLKRTYLDGRTDYFLVDDLPNNRVSEFMRNSVKSGFPSSRNYSASGQRNIVITFLGEKYNYRLKDNESIIPLSNLLLTRNEEKKTREPVFCKIDRDRSKFVRKFRDLHDVSIKSEVLQFDETREVAVCLVPITESFLKYFPEIFEESNINQIQATPKENGLVEWKIPFLGNIVEWITEPNFSKEMGSDRRSVALYPPKVSRDWKLYTLYGVGDADNGRWHLIDENGTVGNDGNLIELESEEYISLIKTNRENKPNRPRAMMFKDGANSQRGILFLQNLEEARLDKEKRATLAVDFGTSNTCLAVNAGTSGVLKLGLSPKKIWGKEHDPNKEREFPGFVPYSWGAQDKGYFPTFLLARNYDERLSNLTPDDLTLEDFFKGDIPSLHEGLEVDPALSEAYYFKSDLKWNPDTQAPWRSMFLGLVLLYSHAEVFFNYESYINDYAFTFPLAFSKDFGDIYNDNMKDLLVKIRSYCYGINSTPEEISYRSVDESTAVAQANMSSGAPGKLEVFVDVGGGTADIAIRHNNKYLVLDSVMVAGNAFFRFAEKNLQDNKPSGAEEFRKHLGRLLQNNQEGFDMSFTKAFKESFTFKEYYSMRVNALSNKSFREREAAILSSGMGQFSYQEYRTRLFFQHIITYALLQACAVAVSEEIDVTNGIHLTLGGNAWGLLMFAKWKRSKDDLIKISNNLLDLLIETLAKSTPKGKLPFLKTLKVKNVELLNEGDLTRAKTCVAIGALTANPQNTDLSQTSPFAGVTIKDLRLNGESKTANFDWYERWSVDNIKQKFGNVSAIDQAAFETPENLEDPLNQSFKAFTGPGNYKDGKTDNMTYWQDINSATVGAIQNIKLGNDGQRLTNVVMNNGVRREISSVPINYFISYILYQADTGLRDFLDELAKINLHWQERK